MRAIKEHTGGHRFWDHAWPGSASLFTASATWAEPWRSAPQGAIGATELACMRPEAGLVNMSRAAVVDYPALVAALRAQRLAGAVLDVFNEEPIPPAAALWEMPNLIITPHISADDPPIYIARCLEILGRNVRYAAFFIRPNGSLETGTATCKRSAAPNVSRLKQFRPSVLSQAHPEFFEMLPPSAHHNRFAILPLQNDTRSAFR